MTARLCHRAARLIRADAHGVMDSLEDPVLMLKQGLREAERALLEEKERLHSLDREWKGLQSIAEAVAEEIKRCDRDTALALSENREDLARASVRLLLKAQRRKKEIAETRKRCEEERVELTGKVKLHEGEFLEAKRRVQEEILRREKEKFRSDKSLFDADSKWRESFCISEEEVEMELLRRKTAQTGKEA